jgi:hypothetical protein
MKKIILLIFLSTIFYFNAKSQSRLGYKEEAIYLEYPNKHFKVDYANDGSKYIYFQDPEARYNFYLNSNNVCDLFVIIFIDLKYMNKRISKLNDEAVKISNTEWLKYMDKGIIKITFNSDDGLPILRYEYEEIY